MSIEIKNLTYTYMKKTAFECTALKNVSIAIKEGTFTAIAGHTGSGKSTLVQHLNGILQPGQGCVLVDGVDLSGKDSKALAARRKVGVVFQYPEHQLFEETIERDIAFGPKNMGIPETEVDERVKEAMDFVGLEYEKFRERSPFELSGGQKRRVAIAGVIALRPKYLILDEPTAGLDPCGKEMLLERIIKLRKKEKLTIVLISHNMDDIARLCDRIIVLDRGQVLIDEAPKTAFFKEKELKQAGLAMPQLMQLMVKLKDNGLPIDDLAQFSLENSVNDIMKALKRRKVC